MRIIVNLPAAVHVGPLQARELPTAACVIKRRWRSTGTHMTMKITAAAYSCGHAAARQESPRCVGGHVVCRHRVRFPRAHAIPAGQLPLPRLQASTGAVDKRAITAATRTQQPSAGIVSRRARNNTRKKNHVRMTTIICVCSALLAHSTRRALHLPEADGSDGL